ncbi:MAG: SAM-dependent methyltransferase [Pseudomonadota bacterium]
MIPLSNFDDINSAIKERSFTSLSKSKIWSMSNAYYQSVGKDTFEKNITPNVISSNIFIAQKYAKLIYAAVKDLKNNNILNKNSKIHIIELGSGHGKLSKNLIKYLSLFLGFFEDFKVKIHITDQSDLCVKQIKDRLMSVSFPVEFEIIYSVLDVTFIGEYLEKIDMQSDDLLFVIGNYFLDSLPKDYFRKIENKNEVFLLDDNFLNDSKQLNNKALSDWVGQTGSWNSIDSQPTLDNTSFALRILDKFNNSQTIQICSNFNNLLLNISKFSGNKMCIFSDLFNLENLYNPCVLEAGGYYTPLCLSSLNLCASELNFQPFRQDLNNLHNAFDTQAFWQSQKIDLNDLSLTQERFYLDYKIRNHFEFYFRYIMQENFTKTFSSESEAAIFSENLPFKDLILNQVFSPVKFSGQLLDGFRFKQLELILKEIKMLLSDGDDFFCNKKINIDFDFSADLEKFEYELKESINQISSFSNLELNYVKSLKSCNEFNVSIVSQDRLHFHIDKMDNLQEHSNRMFIHSFFSFIDLFIICINMLIY